MKTHSILVLLILTLIYPVTCISEELPLKLQIALMNKVISLEKKLTNKSDITIFVLDAPDIANLFKAQEGVKKGNIKISQVSSGKVLPTEKFDVIYFANPKHEGNAIAYANGSKALSIYPLIDGMNMLGSLGLGIKSGKPTFLLNLSQSKSEGLDWNPAILKVATTK